MAGRRRKLVGAVTLAVGSVAGSALIFKRKRELINLGKAKDKRSNG